jgi:hypothetical protein
VNRAVVDVHNQSLSVGISPLRKKGLVEQLKNLSGIMCAVDIGASPEPIDEMKPLWIPHDCQHERFALDIGPGFCCQLIVGQSPYSARTREKEKPGIIARHQMSPTVFSRRFWVENY